MNKTLKTNSRAMSPEKRASIASRQKIRWAKIRAATVCGGKKTPAAAVKLTAGANSPRNLAKANGKGSAKQGLPGALLWKVTSAKEAKGRLVAAAPAAGSGSYRDENPKLIARSPFNREYFDPEKLAELTENVRKKGIIEPLIVRAVKEGEWFVEEYTSGGENGWQVTCHAFIDHFRTLAPNAPATYWSTWHPPEFKTRETAEANLPKWELVAGERRWRAALRAELSAVPILVRVLDDREAIELQIIENLQREDLRPLDEARAYKQLKDFGFTMKELTDKLDLAESTIYGRLKLLELPAEAAHAVELGQLSASHAELITRLETPEAQVKLAGEMLKEKDVYSGGEMVKERANFREAKAMAEEAVAHEKKEKAWQKSSEEYLQRGYKVLTLEQGAKVFHFGSLRKVYVGVTDVCDLDPEKRTWQKLLTDNPKAPQVLVAPNEHTYGSGAKLRIVYPRQGAEKALRYAEFPWAVAPKGEKKVDPEVQRKREEEKREREAQELFVANSQRVTKIIAAAEAREPNADFWRLLIDADRSNHQESIVQRRQLTIDAADKRKPDWKRQQEALEEFIAKADGKTLRGLALEMYLWEYGNRINEDLAEGAEKVFGLKLQTAGKRKKKK